MTKDIRQFLKYYIGFECQNSRGDTLYLNAGVLDNIFRYKQPVKLIARRLDSMTEEEAQELLKIRFNHPWQNPIYQRHSSLCIDFKFSSGPGEFSESQLDWDMLNGEAFHYLLSRGFWLFGDDWFDEGLIIDKNSLK